MAENYGTRETIAVLRKTEKTLHRAVLADIKTAAKPLADQIDANFPQGPPLSGYDNQGRSGWNKRKSTTTRVGTGGKTANGDWNLVSIGINDGPRVTFDRAAKGNLATNLGARYGAPSRAAWKTSDTLNRETVVAVQAAIDRQVAIINRELAGGG